MHIGGGTEFGSDRRAATASAAAAAIETNENYHRKRSSANNAVRYALALHRNRMRRAIGAGRSPLGRLRRASCSPRRCAASVTKRSTSANTAFHSFQFNSKENSINNDSPGIRHRSGSEPARHQLTIIAESTATVTWRVPRRSGRP